MQQMRGKIANRMQAKMQNISKMQELLAQIWAKLREIEVFVYIAMKLFFKIIAFCDLFLPENSCVGEKCLLK